MTITLDVPPDLETSFEQAARLQGKDVSTFLLDSGRMRIRPDVLSETESNLFSIINAPIPPKVRAERDALIAEQEQRTLSAEEQQRLYDLIDHVELANAERWNAVAKLAQIRGLSLSEMAEQLEVPLH